MKQGDKVYLRPTNIASDELREKVATMGDDVVGEIVVVTGIDVCTVLLPPGITIEGHSHVFDENRHYIDLHGSHLQLVTIECPKCGESEGRHKGGCALAPEMYRTPQGFAVRKTPRSYHGNFDG